MAAFGPSVIQTYTGRYIEPLNPDPADICIEDIAHHLSNLCRFTGAVMSYYSVAQHAVLVSQRVEELARECGFDEVQVREAALAGLHHDDSEAYLVDVPRPVKRLLPDYQAAERKLEAAIVEHFDLNGEYGDLVHRADDELLATEARDLMTGGGAGWGLLRAPLEKHIEGRPPSYAEVRFLTRHAQLTR